MAQSVDKITTQKPAHGANGGSLNDPTLLNHKARAFSGWPMIIAWAAMLIFTFHACTHMVAAGDTWVAMACGRHFANHGVDTVEPFSANSHEAGPTAEEVENWPGWAQKIADVVGLDTVRKVHPTGWVNQNWLTHLIFYKATTALGSEEEPYYNALVYWKFAVYIATVICVFYAGVKMGANPALAAAFACFAMFAGRSFLDVRPAGFSNLLVAVFFLILVLATYRNVLYIWLLVPLVIFWSNVHGGYIYAFIVLAPFFILHALVVLPRKWAVSAGGIGLWMALWAFAYKFRSGLHGDILEYAGRSSLTVASPASDPIFYFIVLLSAASVVLTYRKSVTTELLYAYHIGVSALLFLVIFIWRFPIRIPGYLPTRIYDEIRHEATVGQLTFPAVFAIITAIIVVTAFFKDKLVTIGPKGLGHVAGAGAAAVFASILFNPFHLTNITHTFVISVSRHAERWRNIHEWHPAFSWSNPVGTGFPFLILVVMFAGILVLWLFARRMLQMPEASGKFKKKSTSPNTMAVVIPVFGTLTAIIAGWIVFLSFSWIPLSFLGFAWCTFFTVIILLSVYRSVHFIHLVIPLTALAMLAARNQPGYSGTYIYAYVTIPAYVIVSFISARLSPKVAIKPLNMAFVGLAAVLSLAIVLMYNPFGNQFDAAESAFSAFFSLDRPWSPVYEGKSRLRYEGLFNVLYAVNIIALLVYLGSPYLKKFLQVPAEEQPDQTAEPYRLPQIDLPLIIIAALTVYMAVKSRRFIPIAAYVACPVVALLIDRTIRTLSALWNFRKTGKAFVSPMPAGMQYGLTGVAIVATMFFGVWWGAKFKQVYLDPWPNDPRLNSVFMRMTASDAKPFDAGAFIRTNKMEGKMFNYWTEGGFIAFAQDPDPETGFTPLQLFMDGRAQAAYDRAAFDLWSHISTGGPTAMQVRRRERAGGKPMTAEEGKKIGEWVDKQLRPRNVWVVLMPATQFDKEFVKGLEHSPKWMLVFFNNKQKLFVDIMSPRGKAMFDGMSTGETVYPNEFTKNLTLGHNTFIFGTDNAAKKRALDMVIKAFYEYPSPTPMLEILLVGGKFPHLRPHIEQFCTQYAQQFEKERRELIKKDGYRLWVDSARLANIYLRNVAQSRNQGERVKTYNERIRLYDSQRADILRTKRW